MTDHFHTCRYCGVSVRCRNESCTEHDICPGCEEEMLEALEIEMMSDAIEAWAFSEFYRTERDVKILGPEGITLDDFDSKDGKE